MKFYLRKRGFDKKIKNKSRKVEEERKKEKKGKKMKKK